MAEALAADQGDVSAGAYETSRYQSYAAPTNANEFHAQSNSYAGAGDWTVNIMMFTVVVGYTILGVSLFFAWCVAALVTRMFLLSCNSPLTFRLLLPVFIVLQFAAHFPSAPPSPSAAAQSGKPRPPAMWHSNSCASILRRMSSKCSNRPSWRT